MEQKQYDQSVICVNELLTSVCEDKSIPNDKFYVVFNNFGLNHENFKPHDGNMHYYKNINADALSKLKPVQLYELLCLLGATIPQHSTTILCGIKFLECQLQKEAQLAQNSN